MTIREIILHPRYREFAAWATRRGMHVLPNSYPWRLMGISDEKFLSMPLKTAAGGELIEGEAKLAQLRVIRAQERLVGGYWDLWLEDQKIHGPAPVAAAVPAGPDGGGWLF